MSLFGQVWLWSLVAFLLGTLITWLLLVRPVQKRNRELEARLAESEARRPSEPVEPANAEPVPTRTFAAPEAEPGYPADQGYRAEERYGIERSDPVEAAFEPDFPLEREPAYLPEPAPEPPPEPVREPVAVEPEPEPEPEPSWPERSTRSGHALFSERPVSEGRHQAGGLGSVLEPERERSYEPDPEPAAEQAAERTTVMPPVPAEPEPQPEPQPEPESVRAEPLFEERPPVREEPGSVFQPYIEPEPLHADHPDHTGTIGFGEVPEAAEQAEHPAPEPEETAVTAGASAFAFEDQGAPEESPAESTQVLPKRQPRDSPRGGFDPPQPIQPSMRSIERREPVPETEAARSGSLFEPVVRPNQGAAVPPPAESLAPTPPPARHHAPDAALPPGPFGPGSAMPRPGGGRPAEEFAVKASVTALRYCTEESPQFPRMVAEVWFRTPADAERVGFRPLT
ncbi:hypothetical protein [Amycolatopsis nigrescens]|uniref:sunset domain-containing protein n=1 Tax=Amycolatopsis nigrescens TaxID=381445 RepID=UPI00036BB3E8|nr:hypothetical protein [Amycolatopsis nigrescens]